MKKIILCICMFITTLCLAFGVACKKEENPLVGFENATHTVEFGSKYRAETVATDANGTEYDTQVTVKNSENETVEALHKTFTVTDKDGYTVIYTADVNGTTYTKTDTLNVKANGSPIVNIEGQESAFILGASYTLPTVKAYDYFDGELTATAEIYKEAGDEDVKCEYDGSGTFTPTETGTYYVKATAQNSVEETAFETLRFFARKQAIDGEWDSFDDEGCEYTTLADSEVKALQWQETFAGRNGVLGVSLKANNAYSGAFRFLPKTDDIAQYEGKEYLVVNVYVDGAEGALLNFLFCNPNATSLPMFDIRYNSWNTFVFKADGALKNWASIFTSDAESSNGYVTGTITKDCTLYFDSVYFASAQELTGGMTEENNVVTLGYEAEGASLAYTVLFDGKPVATDGNTFEAKYVGEYTVYPHIKDSNSVAYVGEPISYVVEGETLSFNAYDETVALNAQEGEYTLPEATAAGYTVNAPTTTFTSWQGETEEKAFDTVKKGYFDFVFTADKTGAKSLYKRVRVRVGDYLTGEVFNVTDADAVTRMSHMGMGASFATVDGREIDTAYKGTKYLKIGYGLNNQYLMKTGYVNFSTSATLDDVSDLNYDRVNVKFYVKATLNDGKTMPAMNMTFMGQKFAITPNAFNEISITSTAYVQRFYRLATVATYADMAFTFTIGLPDGVGFKDTFSELSLYMSNITADTQTVPNGLAFVEDETQTAIFNKDLTAQFFTAEQLVQEGITGEYTGNAIAYTAASNNAGCSVLNNMSRRQMNEFAETYDYVTMWIAVDGGESEEYVSLSGGLLGCANNLNQMSYGRHLFSGSRENFKKWTQFTISTEAFMEYAYGKSTLSLFSIYDEVSVDRTYYIGEITFGKIYTQNDYDNISTDKNGAWS